MIESEFKHMEFPVIVKKDEDGFVVECPLFEGCFTQGDSMEEAMDNIKEVIDMCLEESENQIIARNFKNQSIQMRAVMI